MTIKETGKTEDYIGQYALKQLEMKTKCNNDFYELKKKAEKID